MANIATFGLSNIGFAEIGQDGSMGIEFTSLGLTYQDSCRLVQDEPEIIEFFCEESDDPVISNIKSGKIYLTFSILDADPDTLKELIGGTVTTESGKKIWNAPSSAQIIEKSIKITPQSGMTVCIPRASIRGKFNSQFSKRGVFLVDVTATVLLPQKEGLAKISTEITSPSA